MSFLSSISRRKFLQSAALASAAGIFPRARNSFACPAANTDSSAVLEEFDYGDVSLDNSLYEGQLRQTHAVLMELNDDALLKPFRQMAGQKAPGEDLGGWYAYDPRNGNYLFERGFAPGASFGQWVSALARSYAIDRAPKTREKVIRLNRLYAKTISGDLYEDTRFPAYTFDKLVCGLIDSHKYAGDPDALKILDATAKAAMPHLPPKAVEHGQRWRANPDVSYTWDESYTMPENLFLAFQRGAGEGYKTLGAQYLNEPFYERLADGQNDLAGRHAYSHVNCLCSAMQAYLTLGDEKYLRAAKNGFDMVLAQSFATGGWGPDEELRQTDSADVYGSLTKTHSSFETPCGSYAHFKLMRYLLRVTRDAKYGDSMERVMYNTVLGSMPLQMDGRAFYYSDYNFYGRKVYHAQKWPCCSGTLPQVAADYRICSYFRDGRDLFVNLYVPSTLRWTQRGAPIALAQRGGYPYDSQVQFEVKTSQPAEFAVSFRIPSWSAGASVGVNGKREEAASGSFVRVQREWKNGDRIEVELPMTTRLEAIDARHPDVAAVMVGPLVLFALTDSEPVVTRAQLLAAKKIGAQEWQVETAHGPVRMLPFTGIEEQRYTTYLRVT